MCIDTDVRVPAQGNRCMYWYVRLCTCLCTCTYTCAWTLLFVVGHVREQVHVQAHLKMVFADRVFRSMLLRVYTSTTK